MPDLTIAAQRALHILSTTLMPGAEVTLRTILTLLDDDAVPDVLDALGDAGHLNRIDEDRYRLQPSIQPASPSPDGFHGIVRSLTALAVDADRRLYPHSWRLFPDYDSTGHAFPEAEGAMRWYHRNRTLLIDTLRDALAHRHYDAAVRLAEPLWGLCRAAGHHDDEATTQHLGLEALEKEHCLRSSVIRSRAAHAHTDAHEHGNAEHQATLAIDLARVAADPEALGTALSTRGRARHAAGRHSEAIADLVAALELAVNHNQPRSQALRHRHLGAVLADHGDYEPGLAHLRQAVDLLHRIGDQLGYARALTELGRVQITAHHYAHAIDTLTPALTITLASGVDRYAHDVLALLVTAAEALGHDDQARDYRTHLDRTTFSD